MCDIIEDNEIVKPHVNDPWIQYYPDRPFLISSKGLTKKEKDLTIKLSESSNTVK